MQLGFFYRVGTPSSHLSRYFVVLSFFFSFEYDLFVFLNFPGSGVGVSQWDFLGSTMVTNSHIRLTPDRQSKAGAIWNSVVSNDLILTTGPLLMCHTNICGWLGYIYIRAANRSAIDHSAIGRVLRIFRYILKLHSEWRKLRFFLSLKKCNSISRSTQGCQILAYNYNGTN